MVQCWSVCSAHLEPIPSTWTAASMRQQLQCPAATCDGDCCLARSGRIWDCGKTEKDPVSGHFKIKVQPVHPFLWTNVSCLELHSTWRGRDRLAYSPCTVAPSLAITWDESCRCRVRRGPKLECCRVESGVARAFRVFAESCWSISEGGGQIEIPFRSRDVISYIRVHTMHVHG